MSNQNFENHKRYVVGYHYILLPALFALLIGSFVNLSKCTPDNCYSASLICFGAILLSIVAYYMRIFTLTIQNRAIRAEENLRYYVLTGKLLPAGIRMSQVIALRFAPDEEFVDLVDRALNEQLSSNEIKQAVKNWKGDYHRA
ncbi:MAG: hypothetical protein EBX50_11820 [Chitinophagia bacterium]|nr:hypothetical protein [Chitinophagia bacterium]